MVPSFIVFPETVPVADGIITSVAAGGTSLQILCGLILPFTASHCLCPYNINVFKFISNSVLL